MPARVTSVLRSVWPAVVLSVASAVANAGPTLYERIGGEAKLRATVREFMLIMESDDRINFTFAETDLKKFEQLLFEQLCNLTDGGCKYTGRDMRTSHAKLNITNAQFNALTEDLYLAFDRVHVPYRLQNKVVAMLAPLQRDIVKPHLVPQDTGPPPAVK
jgi:hemoglobin